MRRRYRSAGFLERCRRIKETLERPAFTTDLIVGFPGETEEDFAATCRVAKEVGFCKIHVFSYSPREGTEAARFGDRVEPRIIHERRTRLLELEAELAAEYGRGLVGMVLEVMVEGRDVRQPGNLIGTSCRQLAVSFPDRRGTPLGRCIRVRVRKATG